MANVRIKRLAPNFGYVMTEVLKIDFRASAPAALVMGAKYRVLRTARAAGNAQKIPKNKGLKNALFANGGKRRQTKIGEVSFEMRL